MAINFSQAALQVLNVNVPRDQYYEHQLYTSYYNKLISNSEPGDISIEPGSIGKRCVMRGCLTSIEVQKIVAVAVCALSLAAIIPAFMFPTSDALRIATLVGSIGTAEVSMYCWRNLCNKTDFGKALERERWVHDINAQKLALQHIESVIFQGRDIEKTALVAYKLLGDKSVNVYQNACNELVHYQRLGLLFDACVQQVPPNTNRADTIKALRAAYKAACEQLGTQFYQAIGVLQPTLASNTPM